MSCVANLEGYLWPEAHGHLSMVKVPGSGDKRWVSYIGMFPRILTVLKRDYSNPKP